jgi:uncharacterized protein (DUF427 family)
MASKNIPADVKDLALFLAKHGPRKVLPTPRRVRFSFNGAFVADTDCALHVWEHEYYPQFYLPREAFNVKTESFRVDLQEGKVLKDSQGTVVGRQCNLNVTPGEKLPGRAKTLTEIVCFSESLDGPAEVLRGYIKVAFAAADQWFEEDTPIFVHPKDPFKRIDTLQSNSPIRISLDGTVLAETTTSVHLLETSLPTRYYIPLSSINAAFLRPSDTRSLCPYKGEAQYHDVVLPGGKVSKDLVWYYTRPTSESVGVVNLRCFYNEKVDIDITDVKGKWKRLERPVTHFA